MNWETVIGLEIHAQLSTISKIFSGSATAYGAPPNSQANLVDLAYPGVLPVLNGEAVRMAVKFGLSVDATIAPRSVFARKNYFYPDLPKGYQISQYELPIVAKGHMDIVLDDGTKKRIGITRAHLEEDAGKSLHEGLPKQSGIDLNRAGTPLIEIVSEPDMRSAKEAVAYLKKVHTLVRYLEICDGNMQEGSFRCDANVSVRKIGAGLGTRAEIKNINSFRYVEKAINYEVARQIDVLEGGGKVVQETRLYDPDKGETRSMRSKEEANDYRYFPDPDLPPLVVDGQIMAQTLRSLPELPSVRFERYQKLGISADDARTLVSERPLADYFDAVLAAHPGDRSGRMLANWVLTELLGALHAHGTPVAQSPMAPAALSALVVLVENGTISGKIGKDVFEDSFRTGEPPAAIVERRGLQQISDTAALWEIINRIVAANPKQAEAYTVGGKDGLFGFFVGQVMKETQGRANPVIASDLLHKRLGR